MKTNLERAAELIAADIRNLNDIEKYCGYPEFSREDYYDRNTLQIILEKILSIEHERQRKGDRQFSLTPPGPKFNKYFT